MALTAVCRLCLKKSNQELISLLENDLPNKVRNCASIDVYSLKELPTTVCLVCVQKLDDCWNFRSKCLESDRILRESLQSSLKEENTEYKFKEEEISFSEDDDLDDDNVDLDYFDSNDDYEIKLNILEHTYTCEICLKKFYNCVEHLDHQEEHDGESVFKCDKCSDIFSSRKQLVDHDKNHKKPCPSCGKMILKSSMKLHLIKHTDRHKCLQCTGRFNSNAALNQHVITVHTDIKDHICESCGKRFSSKTAMKVHLRSHSDERLYNCKLCNYAGRTASAIYVHMSTHAQDVCVCEVCSKIFKSTRNLGDHLRRVHSKDKKHSCGYCNKKFVDKYMLRVHIRCHTGMRPYKCQLCDKAFIRSDGLKEHMVIHGKREMHDCKQCNKKFTSKRGVTRHNCLQNVS